MLICGIHDGHNAAAALCRDGELLGALQEERPRRIKNWSGFPERAIETLLKAAGATFADVDVWVFAGEEVVRAPEGPGLDPRVAQVRAYKANCTGLAEVKRQLKRTPLRGAVQALRARHRFDELLERGVPRERITTVKHHMCHAMTAYHGAGASSDALVLTLDGAGDGLCATVSTPRANGDLELLASISEEHSIGILWALMTSLLGMVPLEHEYKIMGMAPYASGQRVRDVADKFHGFFQREGGQWLRAEPFPDPNYAYEFVRDALEFDRFDHVCGGLQLFTEELVGEWVRHWLTTTGRRKLRLSGGVFMNVKLNKVIGELEGVDDLFVFPSCGDETNAIGAIWGHMQRSGQAERIAPIGPFYLGVAPEERAFESAAEQAKAQGYSVERPADLADAVAKLLVEGKPVARVNGAEEFGARALGNRSILADPSKPGVVRTINRAIKCRDFWMPFAPSVLTESVDRYVHNPKGFAAPYMILAFDSRNTDEVAAACHPEDGTIRPQVVRADHNPGYHELLTRFQSLSGRGAVLNTSFNLHGEPIVSSPADALGVLERSGLEDLALGPFLIQKRAPSS